MWCSAGLDPARLITATLAAYESQLLAHLSRYCHCLPHPGQLIRQRFYHYGATPPRPCPRCASLSRQIAAWRLDGHTLAHWIKLAHRTNQLASQLASASTAAEVATLASSLATLTTPLTQFGTPFTDAAELAKTRLADRDRLLDWSALEEAAGRRLLAGQVGIKSPPSESIGVWVYAPPGSSSRAKTPLFKLPLGQAELVAARPDEGTTLTFTHITRADRSGAHARLLAAWLSPRPTCRVLPSAAVSLLDEAAAEFGWSLVIRPADDPLAALVAAGLIANGVELELALTLAAAAAA